MADEQAGDAAAPKSKMKLIIIIAVVVLLAAGGGGAFLFMGGDDSADADAEMAAKNANVPEPASYVNIAQPFLFSVAGKDRERLVQIKVQLMVRGLENEDLARHHSPIVESAILTTFGSASVEQLRTPQGREQLRDQATENIRAAMMALIEQPVIEKVLFTDFVIQ